MLRIGVGIHLVLALVLVGFHVTGYWSVIYLVLLLVGTLMIPVNLAVSVRGRMNHPGTFYGYILGMCAVLSILAYIVATAPTPMPPFFLLIFAIVPAALIASVELFVFRRFTRPNHLD
ncbi:hypothetical protein CKALI_05145 [Corynebacterium kalinowskii]|uniref:Uncharacterized protein n=1 Tax=Corynebacterium kalinowskii TaxID=2675216 RepID=A0A6B8VCN9_9CORY|nr:hypothetical protein [Corynebacterium kalinowskii]QGU01903.1 hypothetical protein CKALI_05145 [Corynebacterium kalinowskii]